MRQERTIPEKAPLLWWRLLAAAAVGIFLAWGFITAAFCQPAPTKPEQAIFFLLLLLAFLETKQSGWYRHADPLELKIFRALWQVLQQVVIFLFVVGLLGFGLVFLVEGIQENIPIVAVGGVVLILLIGFLAMVFYREEEPY